MRDIYCCMYSSGLLYCIFFDILLNKRQKSSLLRKESSVKIGTVVKLKVVTMQRIGGRIYNGGFDIATVFVNSLY
jgi:hypothetical protein